MVIRSCKVCGKTFQRSTLPTPNAGTFCSKECRKRDRRPERGLCFEGIEIFYDKDGYPRTFVKSKGINIHLLVMQRHLGGPIPKGLHVHHLDENKMNFEISNLVLIPMSSHRMLHAKNRVRLVGGDWDTHRICCRCKVLKTLDHFCVAPSQSTGYCGRCKECDKARRKSVT